MRTGMEKAAGGTDAQGAGGQSRWTRIEQWWRRALRSDGHERHTLLLILKSTLAATGSWVISHDVMQAQSPAFAPFSAILIMQVTVYQSVVQSLRYVGAVAAGVAVQAALGFVLGPDLLTFVLVALIGLTLARWPALGSQGSQVVTAAFFAFSTYVGATSTVHKVTQLGQIILLVLIGCGVGVLVNLAVVPPMRYRSAEYGIRTLAQSLHGLVDDMEPALREGELDEESTSQWRSRAMATESEIRQARSGLETARESLYWNPRRLLRRHRGLDAGFTGYEEVLKALERTLYQVSSLTRSLDQWQSREVSEDDGDYRAFLGCYAEFLSSVGEIARVLGTLDEDSLVDQARQLCGLADEAQRCRREVSEHADRENLPLTDPSLPYGVLVVEATRLMEEFQHTCDILQSNVDEAEGRSGEAGCAAAEDTSRSETDSGGSESSGDAGQAVQASRSGEDDPRGAGDGTAGGRSQDKPRPGGAPRGD
ncbi:aromatic acid exporter family protein [Streptomyces sp. NPDC059740]|uniref:FUSC family protein n=1 Tax=Streptomyces sp. NPDC059740 TaxID=3346926 RepID=UPI00365FF338